MKGGMSKKPHPILGALLLLGLWAGLLAAVGLIVGVGTSIIGGVAWLIIAPVMRWLS